MIRVLFVCYANICRSPMAEAVMVARIRDAGLADSITVDSAGTHCPFPGDPPFHRTEAVLREHGIPAFGTARRMSRADLDAFDYILTMDRHNLAAIGRYYGSAGRADVRLFLSYAHAAGTVEMDEVSDPYPDGDYAATYAAVQAGCAALLAHITRQSPE